MSLVCVDVPTVVSSVVLMPMVLPVQCNMGCQGLSAQHQMWRVCISVTSNGSHCHWKICHWKICHWKKVATNNQPGLIQLLESHTALCKRPASVLLASGSACCGTAACIVVMQTLPMDIITSAFEHVHFDSCGVFHTHTLYVSNVAHLICAMCLMHI
jgi:hypothetical protein